MGGVVKVKKNVLEWGWLFIFCLEGGYYVWEEIWVGVKDGLSGVDLDLYSVGLSWGMEFLVGDKLGVILC